MLVVQAHQIDILGAGQLGDGGGGGTGDHEGGVDLAVLQSVSAVAEALIGGVDVLFGQAVSAQDVDGVVVHAGAGVTDGHVLAGQVGNGLDAGVAGDDLDLLHVQGGHGGEAVNLAGLGEQVGAAVSVAHDVGLDEAQLGTVHVHQLNVALRTLALDSGDLAAGAVADLACQHGAEGIVSAGGTTGGEGQLGAGGGGSLGLFLGLVTISAGGLLFGLAAAAGGQDGSHHHDGHQ